MLQENDGLVIFLTSFLSPVTSQSVGSYVGRVNWRVSLKNIGDFVDVKAIEPRIRDIVATSKFESLDDRQKQAVTIFLDTIDGKTRDSFIDTDDTT